jgi:hypothetical protein
MLNAFPVRTRIAGMLILIDPYFSVLPLGKERSRNGVKARKVDPLWLKWVEYINSVAVFFFLDKKLLIKLYK